MKIANITHSDLDGTLCSLVLQNYYGVDNVDITYVGYHNVNTSVMEALNKGIYDKVYITDISISREVAEEIEKGFKEKVVLLDHHCNEKTLFLNEYTWAHIQENDETDLLKTSGCWMTYLYIMDNVVDTYESEWCERIYNPVLADIVDLGRYYDTWLWETLPNKRPNSDKLNTLLYEYGFKRFMEECNRQIDVYESTYIGNSFDFGGINGILLELYENKVNSYIKSASKRVFPMRFDGLFLGVFYGTQYTNKVCHALQDMFPRYDAIICVNMEGSTSIRTNKPNVNVNDLAIRIASINGFSGGGHKSASGISIDPSFRADYIKRLLGL